MKISVRVTARAKREELTGPDADNIFHARVTSPPVDGKANDAVRALIARHFKEAPSRVRLLSGESFRLKVFELPDRSRDKKGDI